MWIRFFRPSSQPFLQHRPKEWFVNNPGHFFQRLPKNRKKSCTIYFNVKWLLNPYLSKKEIQRTWKTKYNIYIFFWEKKRFFKCRFCSRHLLHNFKSWSYFGYVVLFSFSTCATLHKAGSILTIRVARVHLTDGLLEKV